MAAKSEKFEFSGFSVEPQVVEEIAGIAAAKVDGVTAISGGVGTRITKRGGGVTATCVDDSIAIDVHIVAEYGVPLKKLATNVQAVVNEAIESMIGRPATTVDVFVDGITFPPADE